MAGSGANSVSSSRLATASSHSAISLAISEGNEEEDPEWGEEEKNEIGDPNPEGDEGTNGGGDGGDRRNRFASLLSASVKRMSVPNNAATVDGTIPQGTMLDPTRIHHSNRPVDTSRLTMDQFGSVREDQGGKDIFKTIVGCGCFVSITAIVTALFVAANRES